VVPFLHLRWTRPAARENLTSHHRSPAFPSSFAHVFLPIFSPSSRCSSSSVSSEDDPSSPPAAVVRRLMSAASFGYGLFHLAVSLLPARASAAVRLLGFEGERGVGVEALHFAKGGEDMRAPLAT